MISRQAAALVRTAEENIGFYQNKMFGEMYAKAVRDRVYLNDPSLLNFMSNIVIPPESIEVFLDNKELFGAIDMQLWPEVRKAIIEINRDWWKGPQHGRTEVILCGATGTAKSSISMITTLYHLYLLACLKVPQTIYLLPRETSIVFAIMAAKPHVTKRVLYAPLRKMIETMPFFQKHLRPNALIESEMYFEDKNIRIVCAGSDGDAVLGEAIIGSVIDECNFMQVVSKSKKAEVTTGRASFYDQASAVYETVTRRKKSRFITKGPQIGIICVSSSTRYKNDFTDRRVKQIANSNNPADKLVYIYNKKQYEVWPQERYTGEKFQLLVGNDVLSDTRIVKDGEIMPAGAMVLDIPVEYRGDFETNPHGALRDIVGISDSSIAPFIRRRFKIYDCIQAGKETGLESFLIKDNVILGIDGMPTVKPGHYCRNPGRPRYVHIDLSLNSDSCGIAVLRYDGLKECVRENGGRELLPLVSVEMACSISPDAQNEIQIGEVRHWVKTLKDVFGYPIKAVSYDGGMSVESIQQWKKQGMKSRHLSVDKTVTPYMQLRDAINDTRLLMYEQPVLIDELFGLELDEVRNKVDHQPNGSKDCIEASTLIPLLDGSMPAIKDLVGKEFWVYSCTAEGKVVPGFAHNVHKVGTATVLRLQLDSGEYLDCTEDHLIMKRNGEFIEAKDLKEGDSLMPLYKKLSVADSRTALNGYEQVLDNSTGKYAFTHQVVAREAMGFNYGQTKEDRKVLHHIDFNKLNNSPENLTVMSWDSHRDLHNKVGTTNIKKLWQDSGFRERTLLRIAEIGRTTGKINITKYNKSPERIAKLKANGLFKKNGTKAMNTHWLSEEFRKNHKARLSGKNNYQYRQDVNIDNIVSAIDDGARHKKDVLKALNCGWRSYKRALHEGGYSTYEFAKKYLARAREHAVNHKVVKITKSRILRDVYDMTVDGHHNFAIGSGIFVHNCADAVTGAYSLLLSRRSSWISAASDDEEYAASQRAEFDSRFDGDRRA